MNKLTRLYINQAKIKEHLCQNQAYLENSRQRLVILFGKQYLKEELPNIDEIQRLAKENIKYFRLLKADNQQKIYDEIKIVHAPHFKDKCVVCGENILPINDPNKAEEYEDRGNYCKSCDLMINAKLEFFKGYNELEDWVNRLKRCGDKKGLKVGKRTMKKEIILNGIKFYTDKQDKLKQRIIDTWKVDPEEDAKKFNMFRNNLYEVFNVKD